MRILLTGATGGLGRNTALHLRACGHEVLCLGRSPQPLAALQRDGFRTARADLATDDLAPFLDGIEVVVHAAARSSVWGRPADFERDNLHATSRLLDASIACGTRRFVHVSSPSVLYRPRDQIGLRETDPLPPPPNEYARTKALAEKVVLDRATRIEVLGIRPRALWGPWDTALFPRMDRANAARGLPLVRGGAFPVDLTAMSNAVEALEACLRAPTSALGRFHHVSDGAPLPFRRAVEDVFSAVGIRVRWRPVPAIVLRCAAWIAETTARWSGVGEPVLTRYGAGVLSHAQTLDLSSARERLGWTPRHAWTENVATYARWWRERS